MFGPDRDRIALARKFAQQWQADMDDNRGQAQLGNMAKVAISLVVGLAVAGLVGAFLLPVAINEIVDIDTSNWSSGAQSIWDLLDVIIILALGLFFFGVALAATEMVG